MKKSSHEDYIYLAITLFVITLITLYKPAKDATVLNSGPTMTQPK